MPKSTRPKRKSRTCRQQLKELRDKKTEMENLEIINTVRAMVMDKGEIMAFLAAMQKGDAKQPVEAPMMEVDENA